MLNGGCTYNNIVEYNQLINESIDHFPNFSFPFPFHSLICQLGQQIPVQAHAQHLVSVNGQLNNVNEMQAG
jgi:hypothetical protein